jgi:acetyl-CoA C-acetyltransferase
MAQRGLLKLGKRTPVIASYARTPIGAFNGALASLKAPELGAVAIKGACARAGITGNDVGEVLMGNVVSAGVGQAPATQAAIFAGLGEDIPSTTINKVCASGMKSVMVAATQIALGLRDVVVCGGMESMSNVPHYAHLRSGLRLGNGSLVDGVVFDGLWDPYGDQHMGSCAEKCASDHGISRDDQDAYAELSYERSRSSKSFHGQEIVPVEVTQRKKTITITEDEEPGKDTSRLRSLRPAFLKDGTVTAANASKLNDGAASLVVMSLEECEKRSLEPLCAIAGFGDAQREPIDFTIAPSLAVPAALAHAELAMSDVSLHEVNEAFAVVALANAQLLNVDIDRVNQKGGAVSLGHPIGMSGARIVGSLAMQLEDVGVASICNGGGGASAIVLTKL